MKKILTLVAMVLTATVTYAQHITEQEAMDRALQYMNSQMSAQVSGLRAPARGGSIKLESAPVEAQSIYAFNVEDGGFIIASADSRTLPVLGYSTTGSIDWDNMPDNMRAWLKGYDDAVATLGNRTDFKDGNLLDGSGKALARARTARPPVEPLIKTRWSQAPAPYNDMCPLYAGHNPEWQGQRCMTGCIAVTLAQILNYWQWPKALPNGLPAYESVDYEYDANLSWHIDSLPPVAFDWDNMLDEYAPFNYSTWTNDLLGTEAQQQAVATLMRYCSQAVKANYSPIATSSGNSQCRDALVNHFGYTAATLVYDRTQFGIDEWEEMVYTELVAGRPIYYSGTSPNMGTHAFICDGIDGDGLFHINWGWQGSGNGYFSLSVLNPYPNTDSNKGSDYLGYTKQQNMIIGLDPTLEELKITLNDKPELWQHKKMKVLSHNTVSFYLLYNNDAAGTATADYALGTIEADGTLTPRFIGDPNDSIILKNNWMTVEIDSTAFQPGETLRLHPMLRFRHVPEDEWQLIPPLTIYADVGRTKEGRFFITLHPYMLEYVDASITAGLGHLGASSDLTFTVKNPNDQDYVGYIRFKPRYYGKINAEDVTEDTPYTEGDWQIVGAFIRAGQEGDATFLFNPEQGGLIRFMLQQVVGKDDEYTYFDYFSSITMRFDTIYSYDPYLVNNSYVTHEGSHYVYHVELCDRPGVTVPDGVPSDNIYLDCIISSKNGMVRSRIVVSDEIKDYLRALPDSAGSGNYKFTAEVSLDIEQDGEYYVRSYLIEWLDADYKEYIIGAQDLEYFTVTLDYNAIREIGDIKSKDDDSIYDLLGRRINGVPQKNRVYIKGNRKVIINK